MSGRPRPVTGLLRWAAALLFWTAHSRLWVRRHGVRFGCTRCDHRFWAIPDRHGYPRACPLCMGSAYRRDDQGAVS